MLKYNKITTGCSTITKLGEKIQGSALTRQERVNVGTILEQRLNSNGAIWSFKLLISTKCVAQCSVNEPYVWEGSSDLEASTVVPANTTKWTHSGLLSQWLGWSVAGQPTTVAGGGDEGSVYVFVCVYRQCEVARVFVLPNLIVVWCQMSQITSHVRTFMHGWLGKFSRSCCFTLSGPTDQHLICSPALYDRLKHVIGLLMLVGPLTKQIFCGKHQHLILDYTVDLDTG